MHAYMGRLQWRCAHVQLASLEPATPVKRVPLPGEVAHGRVRNEVVLGSCARAVLSNGSRRGGLHLAAIEALHCRTAGTQLRAHADNGRVAVVAEAKVHTGQVVWLALNWAVARCQEVQRVRSRGREHHVVVLAGHPKQPFSRE